MLQDYELKQNNNLRKNKKWCRGWKEQLKQLGNLMNRKSYGRRKAGKLRFVTGLDTPAGLSIYPIVLLAQPRHWLCHKLFWRVTAGLGTGKLVSSLFFYKPLLQSLFYPVFWCLASTTQPCAAALYRRWSTSCSSSECWECPWNFQSEGIRSVWGVPCHMDRSYLEGISCFQSSWERIANSSPYATEYSPA